MSHTRFFFKQLICIECFTQSLTMLFDKKGTKAQKKKKRINKQK